MSIQITELKKRYERENKKVSLSTKILGFLENKNTRAYKSGSIARYLKEDHIAVSRTLKELVKNGKTSFIKPYYYVETRPNNKTTRRNNKTPIKKTNNRRKNIRSKVKT